MRGEYIAFSDGYGIVGYHYKCPECEQVSKFTDCEEGCEECDFSEEYVDPVDWFDEKYGR